MKNARKIVSLTLALVMLLSAFVFSGCGKKETETVTIFTSAEDFRVEYIRQRLTEQFPDYNIVIEYKTSGDHGAALKASGTATECDITHDLEYGYLEQLSAAGVLADLSSYDMSIYTDDAVTGTTFIPELRNGGAIVVNKSVLDSKGVAVPTCYADLLKPEYKGLICMPNPKSSGTGYMFYKSLVNSMGETEALAYFDKLNENITEYTSSGSGPINNLIAGEAGIGLGMTAQAVEKNNTDGAGLEIHFFEEGSPFSMYGVAMIKGKETRQCVKEVFDFFYNTLNQENCEKYYPEKVYKDIDFVIENFPSDIKYADMSGNTAAEKTRLLDLWKY